MISIFMVYINVFYEINSIAIKKYKIIFKRLQKY